MSQIVGVRLTRTETAAVTIKGIGIPTRRRMPPPMFAPAVVMVSPRDPIPKQMPTTADARTNRRVAEFELVPNELNEDEAADHHPKDPDRCGVVLEDGSE